MTVRDEIYGAEDNLDLREVVGIQRRAPSIFGVETLGEGGCG